MRFLRNLRQATRYWWWRQIGKAERLEREAAEARENASFRFKQYVEMRDALWRLKNPPTGSGGALLLAAAEVSRESPNHPCEDAWQEGDTGAWNCERERRGDVCWCMVADELRELEKAFTAYEKHSRDSDGSGEAGQTAKQAGPEGRERGPKASPAPSIEHSGNTGEGK